MERSSEFVIPFIGLKEGRHDFKSQIDNTFFASFHYSEFYNAHFDVHVQLNKKTTLLEFSFDAKGYVTIPCDISTELFDLPLDLSDDLLVKFGSISDSNDDHILYLPVGSYQIDISQQLYEMIVLAIPQKNIHPGIADGTLQSDIIEKLEALAPKHENTHLGEDPRWNKLKDLL